MNRTETKFLILILVSLSTLTAFTKAAQDANSAALNSVVAQEPAAADIVHSAVAGRQPVVEARIAPEPQLPIADQRWKF